jgi:L-threonylcarbamoyladenylate synthase
MSEILELNPKRISWEIVQRAATIIQKGGIILYPTETIYGLGCDLFNEKAVKRLYTIKKRPETKPALVLIGNISMLRELVVDIPLLASRLMKRFWPGPLTILFKAKKNISPLITAGSGMIGVRLSGSKFCVKLLTVCRIPIVSTSANISGKLFLNDIDSLEKIFATEIDLIVDAGNLPSSLSSTVVDVSSGSVKVIREGAIGREQLKLVY